MKKLFFGGKKFIYIHENAILLDIFQNESNSINLIIHKVLDQIDD